VSAYAMFGHSLVRSSLYLPSEKKVMSSISRSNVAM